MFLRKCCYHCQFLMRKLQAALKTLEIFVWGYKSSSVHVKLFSSMTATQRLYPSPNLVSEHRSYWITLLYCYTAFLFILLFLSSKLTIMRSSVHVRVVLRELNPDACTMSKYSDHNSVGCEYMGFNPFMTEVLII